MHAFQLHHLCSRPYRTQSPLRLALSTPVIDDAANICLTRGAGLGHFYRVTHSFTHSLSGNTHTLPTPPPPSSSSPVPVPVTATAMDSGRQEHATVVPVAFGLQTVEETTGTYNA